MKLEQKMMLWSDRKAAPGETDSFQPYLTPYLLPGDKVRGCVIVLPGGGYHARAPHEGGVVAERFNSLGFHAFVLEYRVAPYRWPAPQEDALRAVKIVRAHADERKINPDKIAVLGFSAGGHLACSTGIVFDEIKADNGDECDSVSARPDMLILCYPVITCQEGKAHFGSFQQLLGTEDHAAYAPYSWETRVRPDTPPAFLWHTAEDNAVPVENTLEFALALRRQKIPFETHIFPYGYHGLGLGTHPDFPEVRAWPDLAAVWMRKLGF